MPKKSDHHLGCHHDCQTCLENHPEHHGECHNKKQRIIHFSTQFKLPTKCEAKVINSSDIDLLTSCPRLECEVIDSEHDVTYKICEGTPHERTFCGKQIFKGLKFGGDIEFVLSVPVSIKSCLNKNPIRTDFVVICDVAIGEPQIYWYLPTELPTNPCNQVNLLKLLSIDNLKSEQTDNTVVVSGILVIKNPFDN